VEMGGLRAIENGGGGNGRFIAFALSMVHTAAMGANGSDLQGMLSVGSGSLPGWLDFTVADRPN
jgi:hypothetical protein